MKIPQYARHPGETSRQFTQRKRREIASAIAAFNTFRMGCAFMPGYSSDKMATVESLLRDIKRQCEVKNWR